MTVNIEEQKQRFLDICKTEIHREGTDQLLDWLSKADFFTAPASTKYHGAYAGGLCQHSLDVYDFALKLAPLCEKPLETESLAISALFHDLCKVNFYKTDMRNQKTESGWVSVPYYTIEEKFQYGGHGSKSVFLVERFMRLTLDEAVAINCHMGFSEGGNAVMNVGHAYESCPLAWIIHAADEAAAYLLDRKA